MQMHLDGRKGVHAQRYGWILFVVAIFIVTAVSNGANLTDGLDGLATESSAIVELCRILAYVSGNVNYSGYLNIMYLPGTGEMLILRGIYSATIDFCGTMLFLHKFLWVIPEV